MVASVLDKLGLVVEVPHEGEAVTEGRAYIQYEAVSDDWTCHIELYLPGNLNKYQPAEIWKYRFDWLADALIQVSNCVRSRGLVACEISVLSEGQPPLQHCAEHGK